MSKITVRVKPNSRAVSVEKISGREFIVKVNVAPKEGKANDAVIEQISNYFDIPKSRISILKGLKSKTKIIEVIDEN